MDPRPSAEISRLQHQADRVEDDTLESTRRILALGVETQEIGAKTSEMLHHQGDQLDSIERNMDHINAKVKEAEKGLSDMEKCCGVCVFPWSRTPDFKEDPSTWQGSNGGLTSQQPRGKRSADQARSGTTTSSAGPSGGLITKIRDNDKESEMDDNLTQVSDILGNLRNMAIDFQTEIDGQNKQLDRLQAKAEHNTARIETAKERVVKLNKNA